MTALNVFVQPQAVHVLTDGAGYAPDGSISWIGRKPVTSDSLKAVIAWSGQGSPRRLSDKLQAAAPASQAMLQQALPTIAREMHEEGRSEARQTPRAACSCCWPSTTCNDGELAP